MTKAQALFQAFQDYYDLSMTEAAQELEIGSRQYVSKIMKKDQLSAKLEKSIASKVREAFKRKSGITVEPVANLLVKYHEELEILHEDDGDVTLD